MIPFDEVTEETWQTLSLIMGKPSLLSECLAAVASGEEDAPAAAAELERLVRMEIARTQSGLSTNRRSAATQLNSEQWQFIAEALVKVSEAFRLPGSFDWTDTTESAFSDDAT